MATAAGLYLIGFRVWVSGLCFALCAFVLGTLGQEFVRGGLVRREATGTDLLTAMVGLVMRSRRRYGGYIVHAGIVLMFLGFAGSGYKQEQQVLLSPGESMEIGRFEVRHNRLSESDDGQKQMITAHMTVLRDGERKRARCIRRAGSTASTRPSRPPRSPCGARSRKTCT